MKVLIIGSGPNAPEAADLQGFDQIIAINNAWRVRPDWDECIHPEDFPVDRHPTPNTGQKFIRYDQYVPAMNAYGGVIYCGGTMAFTAGYWALFAHRPRVMAFIGCDMTYAASGNTHFYGTGEADPLRDDITLQSLEGKTNRLLHFASVQGCAAVNLSRDDSRLTFPRAGAADTPEPMQLANAQAAITAENTLDYRAPDGRYWHIRDQFDASKLREIDTLWERAAT